MISKKEALLLKKKLVKWSKQYYLLSAPEITDEEFDEAMQQLIEYENAHPEFIEPNSPTQNIGGPISKKFDKFIHITKMFSLSNAFDTQDLLDFDKRLKKVLNLQKDIDYITELKIDGISISLHYDKGQLTHGITRGDGIVGENITKNIYMIKDIPRTIQYKKKLEVRGEIYLPKHEFERLNLEGAKFANPRNATSGTIRQLDSRVVAKRRLGSFMYAITHLEKHNLNSQIEVLKFLKKNGFNTNPEVKENKNINEVINSIVNYENNRYSYDYEIDGVVIKVNNIKLYDDIGYTSKFPKFMIAYKFKAQLAQTKLLDIFPTVGRTGRITYNAKLKPVRLMGTTISAATLHNADYIENLKINVNDIVSIKKAGDIIPKVLKVIKKNNFKKWNETKNCPICNSELIRIPQEVDQYCINENCPAIIKAKIVHFTSRGAMNIEGLGPEVISLLRKNNFLNTLPSIYELKKHYDQLIKLENLGEKSITKLINSIEKSKSQSLEKFIFGLGIRHVGQKLSKLIAKKINNIKNIEQIDWSNFSQMRDIGVVVNESIKQYFSNQHNINMIKEFITLGVNPISNVEMKSNILNNQTFVITGKLKQPREYYKTLIEINGGNIISSISSKINYLLIGDKPGSKLSKAKALNIKIINEDELNKILGVSNE